MNAPLVYDGTDTIHIPTSMLENGPPFDDQMQGTVLEQLGECASRICYDSFGADKATGKRKGRSSVALHKHILEVINLSVYEHSNFTIVVNDLDVRPFINRKGVWIENNLEITTNLRAILEWDRWTRDINSSPSTKSILQYWGHKLAPQIITECGDRYNSELKDNKLLTEDQAWITLWLSGSRGFSHEQVRHRFAVSQRSTRYVDEAESPYITHPLITKYLNDEHVTVEERSFIGMMINNAINMDRKAYTHLVDELEAYCIMQGMDRITAKKQARGAARGNLGNALSTEMLFSANVTGWKWMLNQRLSKFADAEIRIIYASVLEALQSSQYGHFFEKYTTSPSPDGMGYVLNDH